jgi:hypothetical protein
VLDESSLTAEGGDTQFRRSSSSCERNRVAALRQ